jgi:formamidopyrimidine-DNA glycosylase
MPELPDVEAARRLVERTVTGARIDTVVCPDPSALRNATLRRFRHAVGGAHVRTADRPGKWLSIGTELHDLLGDLGPDALR